MMCFALFAPRPRHILMVGLGGGSLAKFCYRHFPHTRITVLEISAEVIALRDAFHVPPDDARLRIVHADAADYIARHAGRGRRDPGRRLRRRRHACRARQRARFYAACRRALREGGVLVANILTYDPCHDLIVERIAGRLRRHACDFPASPATTICCSPYAPAPARPARAQRRLAARFARRRGLASAAPEQAARAGAGGLAGMAPCLIAATPRARSSIASAAFVCVKWRNL